VIHKPFQVKIEAVELESGTVKTCSDELNGNDASSEEVVFVLTGTPPTRHQLRGMHEVNGLLVPGLQLLAVNDDSLSEDSIGEARARLARASFPLRLRVHGIHATGKRWMNPTLTQKQALGIKVNFSPMGHLRLEMVKAEGRFHQGMGLRSGMVLTNVNGVEISNASSIFNGNRTIKARWMKERLLGELLTSPFSAPPFMVAIDVSSDFQTILKHELSSPVHEADLPLSLQSMTFKLNQFSDTVVRPIRRGVSLPTPSTTPPEAPSGGKEEVPVEMAATKDDVGLTDTALKKSSSLVLSTPQLSVSRDLTNSSIFSSRSGSSLRLSKDKRDRRKKSEFAKADSRLADPVFPMDNDFDDDSDTASELLNDSRHSSVMALTILEDKREGDGSSDDGYQSSEMDINSVDLQEMLPPRPLRRHTDSVIKIHGSRRSFHSGAVIQPGSVEGNSSHQSLLSDEAKDDDFLNDQEGVSNEATSDQEHDFSPFLHPQVTIRDRESSRNDLRFISEQLDGDSLTVTFEKTSNHPRLGLILRQDFAARKSSETVMEKNIVIHGVLQGGLFSDASVLQAGQIIEEIQGEPCPNTTSETFDLLTSLTGQFSMKLRIPS